MYKSQHTIFVYGTLKKGYGNHRLLTSSVFLGSGITVKKYLMTANGIPFVSDEPDNKNITNIVGELYQVDNQTMYQVDMLEGHPSFYKREKVEVEMLDNYNSRCMAWMYFHPPHGELISSGNYDELKFKRYESY